jgi:hypothetical protein
MERGSSSRKHMWSTNDRGYHLSRVVAYLVLYSNGIFNFILRTGLLGLGYLGLWDDLPPRTDRRIHVS